MVTTPNTPAEQTVKQIVRANTRGGANSYTANPVNITNAALVTNGLWRLSIPAEAGQATTLVGSGITVGSGTLVSISGITGLTTVSGLQGLFNIPTLLPSGITAQVIGTGNSYLGANATDIIFSVTSGTPLPNWTITGSGIITNVTISAVSGTYAYPSYFGTPNATPTWIDDATVHAYPVAGLGSTTQDTTKTVQVPVRQIQVNPGETQDWDAYFAQYQINLNQTGQKNTQRQSS